MLIRALALALVAAGPVAAQSLPSVEAPPAIRADLAEGRTLDTVKAWAWDFDQDGAGDYLVQAAYPFPGGNAVSLGYYAYVARDDGFVRAAEFDLTGGIASVTPSPEGLLLEMYVMQDGDPRCCPSGRRTMTLRF